MEWMGHPGMSQHKEQIPAEQSLPGDPAVLKIKRKAGLAQERGADQSIELRRFGRWAFDDCYLGTGCAPVADMDVWWRERVGEQILSDTCDWRFATGDCVVLHAVAIEEKAFEAAIDLETHGLARDRGFD